jgi:hypothetical protein
VRDAITGQPLGSKMEAKRKAHLETGPLTVHCCCCECMSSTLQTGGTAATGGTFKFIKQAATARRAQAIINTRARSMINSKLLGNPALICLTRKNWLFEQKELLLF